MTAYYNEIDPFAAAWLRELIAGGHIAAGEVDERDIRDVMPSDIADFTQCHFFAGIGVWSYALRLAGWPDDRPIWTGSCPCQPFSAAGKGGGFDDERHLWPAFHWLIDQRRPRCVIGEQVASRDGLAWLDLVSTDLENTGYAVGTVDLCAAGVGAPHLRQRSYWLADGTEPRRSGRPIGNAGTDRRPATQFGRLRNASRLADGRQPGRKGRTEQAVPRARGWLERDGAGRRDVRLAGRLANNNNDGRALIEEQRRESIQSEQQTSRGNDADGRGPFSRLAVADGRSIPVPVGRPDQRNGDRSDSAGAGDNFRPGPTNGAWRNADWLGCTDGRWRPVEPGTFPLVNGLAGRVGRLRGYGNAIVAPVAAEFIKAVMDTLA